MSAGGDFGNPLRKFKLVFLGEQSGECAAPPLLAAGSGFPAPFSVRPFRPRRLLAGLTFALRSTSSHSPGSPTPLSHRFFFALTRRSDFDSVPDSTFPFPAACLSSVDLPSRVPSPPYPTLTRPAPGSSCPSLSSSGLPRLTHPSPLP